jgi:lysophospholipase L1-like esterase
MVVLCAWYKHWEASLYKLPSNYPSRSKVQYNSTLLVTLGDSITQGNMSAHWQQHLTLENFQVMNAGVNGDLVQTALRRLDHVIACKPQYISIMLGTNDALAMLSPERYNRYIAKGKISSEVSLEAFKGQFGYMLERLTQETEAQILVLSIPPITEHKGYKANALLSNFRQITKEVCAQFRIEYVPFGEQLESELPDTNPQLEDFAQSLSLQKKATRLYYFLGSTWNQISANRHARFLTDNVHLNETAAIKLAEMVQIALLDLEANKPQAWELTEDH